MLTKNHKNTKQPTLNAKKSRRTSILIYKYSQKYFNYL